MKAKTQIIAVALLIGLLMSCKKDEAPVDVRDPYIGTWAGTQFTSIPSMLIFNQSDAVQLSITKGSTPTEIKVLDLTSNMQYTATINSKGHIYNDAFLSDNTSGTVFSERISGWGEFSGNTLIETGDIVFIIDANTYNGSWSRTLTRK